MWGDSRPECRPHRSVPPPAGWTHYVPSRVGDMKPNIFLLHGLAASTQRAWETQSISPHRYLDWGKREAFPSQSPTDTPWCCQPGVWAASATPHPKMPWAHAPDPNPPHTCAQVSTGGRVQQQLSPGGSGKDAGSRGLDGQKPTLGDGTLCALRCQAQYMLCCPEGFTYKTHSEIQL